MIEVLVTLVIVAFGLLGLGSLQMRLQLSDMESYQRAQALVLLDDITSRIAANRDQASTYVTGASIPLGTGMTCPTDSTTLKETDVLQWCNALQGAAEKIGGSKAGAMIGARGCIENLGFNTYLVTVAWQGMTPTVAPPSSVACGAGSYADPGSSGCTGDLCRRTVTTILNVATLN
jgi:type IV pilus assembly protein PilV